MNEEIRVINATIWQPKRRKNQQNEKNVEHVRFIFLFLVNN